MNVTKKSQGRPPKPETLERQEIERLLANVPAHVAQHKNTGELNRLLEGLEQAKKEILSGYKGNWSVPHTHVFDMESLGDVTDHERKEEILQKDVVLRKRAATNRSKGGDKYRKNASDYAKELCNRNRVFLGKVSPQGTLSVKQAASRIQRYWDDLPVGARLPGEEELERCGIRWGHGKEKIPSVKTIERYIKQASPFGEHRVRQSSCPKK